MTLRSNKSIKKALAVSLCFALATPYAGAAAVVNAAEPDASDYATVYADEGYTLKWNDEFDGTTLNTEDWNVEQHEPGWVNAELQRYTKLDEGNIEVKDGKLKIYPKAVKNEGADQIVASAEVLKGDGFDSVNWSGGAAADGKGSITYKDGSATVKIEDSGTDTWHIQLQQTGLSLVQGHEYELKVKATSDVDRNVLINILDPERSYAWYGGGQNYTLNEEEQVISFTFTVDGKGEAGKERISTDTAALQFNFGKLGTTPADTAAATVTLSEVSLVDLSEDAGTVDVRKAYDYTSGRVSTQNKHDFTYGRFEAKAKVPVGQGYLPAFWLMATDEGNYGQWPKCGEIDIMEVMGQDVYTSYHTVHYGAPGHKEQQKKVNLKETDVSFAADYHTYRLDWEPGSIKWYVDGVFINEVNDWATGSDDESQLAYPAPFDQDFYVILNLAVGGSWVGYPDQDVVDDMENQSFDIDYVRVYQKSEAEYEQMEKEAKKPDPKPVEYRKADESGNFVVNGDFSMDLKEMDAEGDNFELHLDGDCKKNTTWSRKNGEITITSTKEGSQPYHNQLKQTGIPVRKGETYKLTFDAYADEARSIVVDIEGPDNNWTRYLEDTTVDLTTEKKSYELTFTMGEKSDPNGSLEFNMGAQGSLAPVHISNVRLEYVEGEEIIDPIVIPDKTVRADGNYVYNGSFDQGEGRLGYWEIDEADEANVSVTNTKADGERKRELRVKIEVPEGASEANPITVSQSKLAPFAIGNYEFSFDAYMEDGSKDGMKAVLAGTEYNPELSTAKQTFSYPVEITENVERDDSNVAFEFTKPGIYYLDNVVFTEAAMIKNGSFNSALSGYQYGVYNGGDATFGVDSQKAGNDTAFDADIKDTGDENWSVQLKQAGVTLEKGKWYKLTFDAKATVDRTISVVMQGDESKKWDVYSGANDIELTANWKSFSKVFEMKADTDTNALLSVSLGTFDDRITSGHHVYLDNFVLEETDERVEEPTPTATPSKEPTASPEATATPSKNPDATPEVSPSAKPSEGVSPTVSPSSVPTYAPKAVKNKKTTFSIKNKAKVKKTAKIKVKDKDKIKSITINGKKVKIKKNKTSVTVNLKKYKKALKKKGKWNKLVVVDKKGKKTTIKFKTK